MTDFLSLPETHLDRDLLALLQNRVGRNVIRYQQIELFLKLALRHTSFEPPAADSENHLPSVVLRDSTLGRLFEEAKRRVRFDDEQFVIEVGSTLDRVLEDRNALVHEFLHSQQRRLRSDEGIRAAIRELDEQHGRAEFVLHLAQGLSTVAMLEAIENGRFADEDERDQLQSAFVAAVRRTGVEVAEEAADARSEMVAVIVDIVRRAELEYGAVDRGTHLATAGHLVARQFPGLKYSQLGFDGLRSLVESAGFETWAESGPNSSAQIVRFRSGRR